MTTISSNTLFHFTSSVNNLINILENEFVAHYCLEDFGLTFAGEEDLHHIALPIICFCDIPLSQTSLHMKHYGQYAIGMSKSWGQKNHVTPVLYTHPNSPTIHSLNSLMEIEADDEKLGKKLHADLDRLTCLCKTYEGEFIRDNKSLGNIRFYDEREWRYIFGVHTLGIPILNEKDFRVDDIREKANARLEKFPLSFNPHDIRYIIVSDEVEILTMIESIRKIKGKYKQSDIDLLCSRIISAKKIAEDF